MNPNRNTGIKGENMALRYLRKIKYDILEQNWRSGHKEIDIIARDTNCLVIVEVKTRTNKSFHDPIEDVSLQKQSFLIHAAEEYLYKNNLNMDVRFDIIVIYIYQNQSHLKHIKDAFHPVA